MTKTLTAIQQVEGILTNMEFKSILPSHVNEEKFRQVVVTALQKNSDLLNLNRMSLYSACKECATDGLLPDGREAALVPFKGSVKYMPMVQGVTKMARNSGEIATIDAQVVYVNDEFSSWVDEKGAHFRHEKTRKEKGAVLLTYAYAITKDGGFFFEEIDEEQMKAIQECSKGKNTPWNGPFKNEMRRKSALRKLCKYRIPSSSDIDTVIRRDDDFYDINNAGKPVDEEKPAEVKKSKLEDVVESANSEEVKVEKINNKDTVADKDAVVDAEFAEEKVSDESPLQMIGHVKEVKSKQGETNGKKWTRFGININGVFYGTFSTTIQGLAVQAMGDSLGLEIEYETAEINNTIVKNIIRARILEPSEAPTKVTKTEPVTSETVTSETIPI